MDSTAYRSPTATVSRNVPNVTDSYNMWNNCEAEKHQILEWLSPPAPWDRHRAVSESRVDGVGEWLLRTNEFEKWHTSENQAAHPVLFCCGDPGVGKTYLSSLVIDTLCDSIGEESVAVACVYCDFHEEQSVAGVLVALLKQLVAGLESVPQEIAKAFERPMRAADTRTLRLSAIRAMLIKSLSPLQRGFICIDALDEFPTKHRPELWDSLQLIIRQCPNIRLFITGRPHIREEVKRYFPGSPDLDPIKPTKEDIREYIATRLKKDPELDAMDIELEADIIRIILDKISEAFLLVSLVMDAVLEDATIHQRRQTLHLMTNGFDLDDAYSAILRRIREQRGDRVKLGMDALMWVSRSGRQLKVEELCHALAVEAGATDLNVRDVPSIMTLSSCTFGLITIDEQTSTVRLIHFTLQEYLAAHPDLFTTPHSLMAETCLTYLNFHSVCELSATPGSIPSIAPFLHYASCYWGFHARKEMTQDVKHHALQPLRRDANHIPIVWPLSDSRAPNCESLENRDRMPSSITHPNASCKRAHTLTATKSDTLPTIYDPLGASFYPPSLHKPPREKLVRFKQSPPNRLRSSLAPSISISAPGSGSAFRFFLCVLILIIFIFLALIISQGDGDSFELFPAPADPGADWDPLAS